MKPSLQLKIGQQLTMTPQLQQAIRLLQLSTLDLQQEIQDALDGNPLLEVEEEFEPAVAEERYETALKNESASSNNESEQETDSQWSEDIPEELAVDSNWEDTYSTLPSSSSDSEDGYDFESRATAGESLQAHLEWQLNLTPMSERDQLIAYTLIDSINTEGYLTSSLEELMESLNENDDEDPVEEDELLMVLHHLQQFDPPGVAARDLAECLTIQLRQLPVETQWRQQALDIIAQHLNLLGTRDYATLMRRTRLSEEELAAVIHLIQTLNPRPGASITSGDSEYVIPDVVVSKKEGQWLIELNQDAMPRLRINNSYASLIKRADSSSDNTYLKNQLQEARWFIKSLQSRNDTLLKVATKIVEFQLDFFEEGEEAMRPMVLADIAQAVEMHESTISRVTTQKFMHTPRGVFELKYFFSSHVGTSDGGEASSTAIRAIIKKLIAEEPPKKPLSDAKLATLLEDQGINVARRTVAKYREAMGIAPSNERKRLV
ncbi:RNA polymerase factor sigma-54 [Pokkaliibacter plantistimulans]|uniref:RNA polymerase sigma-54 factor n=1 Tax=Proteobacteria bacterium 228 TaxID=2083153 RepID=A0A2S5KJ46_9PROT|nr:RNA polymerase factor sigma-54 [Pokkaliibacter plantistimulans]PPC74772.1 RNA polymerase factor sigma-54 [Pokkaliibacter plantistimulans]